MAKVKTQTKQPRRRILVIANETVERALLQHTVTLRPGGSPDADVLVIAPALNSRLRYWLSDEDEARRSAKLRLAACLQRLASAGIQAAGRVGDADPLQAISDGLHEFRADEIVLATHPDEHSHWLARDLVERARRRFSQPILHIPAGSESAELLADGGRSAPIVDRPAAAPA